MLSRFEHDLTVESIAEQYSLSTITKSAPLASEQPIYPQDNEIIDPVPTTKKFYEIIDDSLILDDVRHCINDMILFLTSNFYQTTLLSCASILTSASTASTTATASTSQSSTPLSISFHDLSLISATTTTSLPSTPSTPHSRFHRQFTRFSSTTNQEHSFNTEHLLRLPPASTRYNDAISPSNLTPPSSAQSSIMGKKRRKNKSKSQEQPPSELLLNSNNNNNSNTRFDTSDNHQLLRQATFNVILADDGSDFVVVDEYTEADRTENDGDNLNVAV